MDECDLESLQTRRKMAKLTIFFKMKKGLAPEYLQSLLPEEVGKNIEYNLRNSNHVRLPKISKNYFLKSFLPSVIRAWNRLSDNIRILDTVEEFKKALMRLMCKSQPYKPYLTGTTEGHIHLSRFRMKLSGLNSHRKKYHFINNSVCPKCTHPVEDEVHFFFECNAYAAERNILIDHLRRLLPGYIDKLNHLGTKNNRKIISKLIIFGKKTEQIDYNIFTVPNLLLVTPELLATRCW